MKASILAADLKKVDPDRYLPNSIPVMSGNSGKAQKLLGWSPVIPLTQTLADMLDVIRQK